MTILYMYNNSHFGMSTASTHTAPHFTPPPHRHQPAVTADVVNPHNCRLIVSPVKKSDSFRLNGIEITSDSSSLLLSSSSPKMMVRVYGGDGLSGSSGSKKPGLRMMFGIKSSVVHSSASEGSQ